MKVSEIMSKFVQTVNPKDSIKDAIGRMIKNKTDYVLVIERGEIIGILTERDILKRFVLKDKTAKQAKCEDSMKRNVVVVGADTELSHAIVLMEKHGKKKLPVVQYGNLVGMLTLTDILRNAHKIEKSDLRELSKLIPETKG